MWRAILILTLVVCAPLARAQQVDTGGIRGGLAVTLGKSEGAREAALLNSGTFIVANVATDTAGAEALRASLFQQGLLGAVRVMEPLNPPSIPMLDDSVALLLADRAEPAPAEAEILRVLRPRGKALVKRGGGTEWITKPLPDGLGEWTHYNNDAGDNEVSSDRLVGPPGGVQWIAGTNSDDDRNALRICDGIAVCIEHEKSALLPHQALRTMVARDAYSGVELWRVPAPKAEGKWTGQVEPEHAGGFVAVAGRVFVQWTGVKHLIAYDLATGKTLLSYDKGYAAPVDEPEYKTRPDQRYKNYTLLATAQHVYQCAGADVFALDAATGALRWKHTQKEGKAYTEPALDGGRLVLAESTVDSKGTRPLLGYIRAWVLPVAAVVGLDTATGAVAWRTPVEDPGTFTLDQCARDGVYYLGTTSNKLGKANEIWVKPDVPEMPVAAFSVKDGKQLWRRPLRWPAGHPPYLMATSTHVWFTSHEGAIGVAKDGTGNLLERHGKQSKDFDLWGCNTSWMSENYVFSRLSTVRLKDGEIRYNGAARSGCVIGSIPALGMLFTNSTGCGCWSYLPGRNAVHCRDTASWRTPAAFTRLFPGTAKPADAAAGTWPAPGEWPQYMRDAARSNWTDCEISAKPQEAWKDQLPASKAPRQIQDEWMRNPNRPGTLTAPTVAEGTVVVGLVDQHALAAFDAATGKRRWLVQLDGAIDSPGTILKGAVYVGTRGGWVYALNRDTGALIWRFHAAPHAYSHVINGQLESVWPVSGSLPVTSDNLLLAVAGRNVETDQGAFWYALDPATGAVRRSGRIKDDNEVFVRNSSRMRENRIMGTLTVPIVSGETAILSMRVGFKTDSGDLLSGGRDFPVNLYDVKGGAGWHLPIPGVYGIVWNGIEMKTRTGSCVAMGGLTGLQVAHRGKDLVMLGGGHSDARGWVQRGNVGRFQRKPVDPQNRGHNDLSTVVWKGGAGNGSRDGTVTGLAVAGSTVLFVAREGNDQGPVLLRVHDYASGTKRHEIKLPSPAVYAGVAVSNGLVVVTCRDGSVLALR